MESEREHYSPVRVPPFLFILVCSSRLSLLFLTVHSLVVGLIYHLLFSIAAPSALLGVGLEETQQKWWLQPQPETRNQESTCTQLLLPDMCVTQFPSKHFCQFLSLLSVKLRGRKYKKVVFWHEFLCFFWWVVEIGEF